MLHKWSGLFLSIPESKQNLSEKEKFRVSEEITPSKLGFVKMTGEDKKQPCPECSGLLRPRGLGMKASGRRKKYCLIKYALPDF